MDAARDPLPYPFPAPGFEDLYDDDELARIERATRDPESAGPAEVRAYPRARRFGIVGAVMTGAMVGVAEVLEPERARQHIIEYVPDRVDESGQPVTYHHVPGDPRASRIVVRPWLFGRLRRGG
jgi:hypothetical protein